MDRFGTFIIACLFYLFFGMKYLPTQRNIRKWTAAPASVTIPYKGDRP